jgi:beta-glucuronidase
MKLISIFLLTVIFNISGQEILQKQLMDVINRNITSLNGKWNIIIDPYEIGYFDYRLAESPEGFFKNQKPKDKTERIEYDFDKSETINVPGDWNSQKPQLLYYEGALWYKKSFDFALKPGKKLFIYFGAINYKAIVYLNGIKLGSHEGGFTPFQFEITDLVKDKDNFIVVKVNNNRSAEYVPTVNTDWWNYGGITRDVWLVEENEIFVKDFSFTLQKQKQSSISLNIELNKPIGEIEIGIEIPELKIIEKTTTNPDGRVHFLLNAKPALWSPENPKLYEIKISCLGAKLKDKIGFRTIEAKGNSILLNGKPVFLRGISIHEEMPLRASRANGWDDAKVLLGWAKELGCNFVRLAHYPHNEYMVRLADSLGLMVWSEIPVYWTIQFGNNQTYTLAEKMLEDNITRDKNRASIIIWSVGNETPVNEQRTLFMSKLAKRAKQLDSTRLVSAALEVHRDAVYDSLYKIDDPLGQYLDIVSCNEYVGWYDGLPMKTEKITWQCAYNKPFIFSELGAEAPYGLHGDSLTRWSEEYQEYFYKKQIAMLKRVPFLSGLSPWILADFRSPRRLLPGIQDGWNKKGLVSTNGQKKKAFFVLKGWYNEIEVNGRIKNNGGSK